MRTNNCDKRGYGSKHAAREANANNGKSLRVYYHRACNAYHVTKNMNLGGRQKPRTAREYRDQEKLEPWA